MDELDMLVDYHKDVGLAASAYLSAAVLTEDPVLKDVFLDLSGDAMKVLKMVHSLISELGGTVQ